MELNIALAVFFLSVAIGIIVWSRRSNSRAREAAWKVEDQNGILRCTNPDGSKQSVTWDDLRSIQMETNDRGPLEPDVFWILKDSKSTCRFPSGAQGEDDLKKKLFGMPNFNLKLFIEEASISIQNRVFDLWTAE